MDSDFIHKHSMMRCFELAEKGLGNTYPNPLVGSVIVHNGKIIGEGFHQKCGDNHAEVNAVESVKNKSLLLECTLYVNLEPCAHVGRTPACSKMIIEKKIPRVVISNYDPFEKVAGKGVEMLRDAGVEVITGVLENEGEFLNRRFFTFHRKKRPYIILKWAQTLDGFIDSKRKNGEDKPDWITNDSARVLVHKWRTEEAAILVGTNTAEKDNPALTVREWAGNQPVRLVLDSNLRLNRNLKLLDGLVPSLVFTSKDAASEKNLEFVKIDFKNNVLEQVFNVCYNREIQSLIVEGGSILLSSFITQNLWDEARIFIGNKIFVNGVKAPEILIENYSKSIIGDSSLRILFR